jgi:DHA1 family bicyclomycin/chloramphenicol resistance-like MFS transporter
MACVMIGSCAVAVTVLALGTPAYRKGGWAEHAGRDDGQRVSADE